MSGDEALLERVYQQWHRLFLYWCTAPCAGRTAAWIFDMDVALFRCWVARDLDTVRRLLDDTALQRVRHAVRLNCDAQGQAVRRYSAEHLQATELPAQVARQLAALLPVYHFL